MKVAALQVPLSAAGALDVVAGAVARCEAEGVSILCCPEAVLGGLADYAPAPAAIAIAVRCLDAILAPLSSPRVTTIVGFTELAPDGHLFNSAAVWHRGQLAGVYRKHHTAIRKSVYTPGVAAPVFHAAGLTFGVLLCRDTLFPEPAATLAAQRAAVLFIPTNNGLPGHRSGPALAADATAAGAALARRHGVWAVRADVCGSKGELTAHGSTSIIGPDGTVLQQANPDRPELLVAVIP